MKQSVDKYIIDTFNKSGRDHPRNPNTKSSAQRQREYRQRQKFNFLISVMSDENFKEVQQ